MSIELTDDSTVDECNRSSVTETTVITIVRSYVGKVLENKVLAVELIDEKILTPVYEYLRSTGEDFRIMVLPDHPTPIRIRTHTIDPVPFMIYSSDEERVGVDCLCEESAAATDTYVPNGFTLMEHLIK